MSFIQFDRIGDSKSGLTGIWSVVNTRGSSLGKVQWYAPWRRYVFDLDKPVLLDSHCLREVADFCERQTRARKTSRSPALLG